MKNANTNKMTRFPLSDSWSQINLLVHRPERGRTSVRTNAKKYWGFIQILKICINIENLHKYWILVQKPKKTLNTHLPQAKILLEELNRLCPKVDFEQTKEKPNKIMELQTVKNTKERSTEIWQDFSKKYTINQHTEFP